jgi:hypothetical protein
MQRIWFFLAISLASCAGLQQFDNHLVAIYYDRNHDGIVDLVRHHNRSYDLDWILCDTDFDGYYDLRINVALGGARERVHIPVEDNVPITPLLKPLPKAWTSWHPET